MQRWVWQVLGPIACEVECADSSHKDMLEQHVPGRPPPPARPAIPAASSLMHPCRHCVLEDKEARWKMIRLASVRLSMPCARQLLVTWPCDLLRFRAVVWCRKDWRSQLPLHTL